MNELPNRPHLFPREVQRFLEIGHSTLYRWLKNGTIPAKKVGDIYRIPRAEFIAWYNSKDSVQP